MKAVFKVVSNVDGSLFSAMHPRGVSEKSRGSIALSVYKILSHRVIGYAKGKKTVPPFGKIFAFDSADAAWRFKHNVDCSRIGSNGVNLEVWEAKTSKSSDADGCIPNLIAPLKFIRAWWSGRTDLSRFSQDSPSCSVFCDDLTLVKKLRRVARCRC